MKQYFASIRASRYFPAILPKNPGDVDKINAKAKEDGAAFNLASSPKTMMNVNPEPTELQTSANKSVLNQKYLRIERNNIKNIVTSRPLND
ncbi:hypothetical protein [Serratia marcescens]|uniref:hypothetical protein n=1 Tax=Serratia marcescens TaxID=615 RepID=UPI00339D009E